MSKFMHWTYIAIISVLAIVLWQTRSDLDSLERQLAIATTPVVIEDATPAEPAASRDRQVYYLEALVEELEAENRALTLLITQRSDANGEMNDHDYDAMLAADEDYDDVVRQEDVAQEIGEDSTPPTPRVMDQMNLEVRFSEEEVDPDWAYVSETSLRDLFITLEGLRFYQLDSADCRSSLCRLVVTPLEDDRPFNSRLFSSEIRNMEGFGDQVMMMVIERQDEPQVEIYIDRSGG
ncbi:hypothetical protein FM042_07670 [Aliidiomarina halalkaliphila]|uniref:Uncharacterized protein n=1 Tax=Aliidiomarina halalkaliphila TaxID=2593535 RepID=A0A552X1D3_9GAMM|nr:hypothetical protein [Aliidiomarina halalkaliphila]TRW48852.1 hypothetical protein FM042_07670 [Aliidiomarina halalkaliphila]